MLEHRQALRQACACVLALLLLAWLGVARAAAPLATKAAAQPLWSDWAAVRFDHPGRTGDTPVMTTNALAQDAQGFMWFGGDEGLARWDGHHLKVYQHDAARPDSLPHDHIDALHVDASGRLWVGTRLGLAWFDAEHQAFRPVALAPAPQVVGVRSIASDATGRLWVRGESTLYMLDIASGQARRIDPAPLGSRWTGPLYIDRRGTVWLGTPTGPARLRPGATRFERAPWVDPPAVPIDRDRVMGYAEDANGDLWISTVGGLLVVPNGDDRLHRYQGPLAAALAEQEVKNLILARPGVLWATIQRVAGLVEIDFNRGLLRRMVHDSTIPTSLSHDEVRGVMRDRDGALWVATLFGVDRHDPGNEVVQSVISANWTPGAPRLQDIRSITAVPDGKVWVHNRRRGVDLIDPRLRRVGGLVAASWSDTTLGQEDVFSIIDGGDGTVWLGTLRGLFRADRDGRRVHRVMAWAQRNDRVVQSLARVGSSLWVGTETEVLRYDLLTQQAVASYSGEALGARRTAGGRVFALLDDGQGNLWVGSARGLSVIRLDSGQARVFGAGELAHPLTSATVTALMRDPQGRVWVGTDDAGIVVLQPGAAGSWSWRRVGRDRGLRNLFINGLRQDEQGRVWANTDDGVALIDPDTLQARLYDRADGLIMTAHVSTSHTTLPSGELVFGGPIGLNVVRPWLAMPLRRPPAPVVSALRVGSRDVAVARPQSQSGVPTELQLQPGERSLSVEFVMLDYAAPERVTYAYRLEGYDSDWVNADAMHRQAVYTGLAPGSYQLRVRGTDRHGQTSESDFVLPLRVLPAWYQTLWARALLLLLLATLVALVVQARTRVLRRNQKLLERKIEQRGRELAAVQDELRQRAEETTRLKSEFLANMSHEIRTPMNAVIGLAHLTLGTDLNPKQRDYVSKIRRSGKNLLRIINDILDLSKIEAGRLDLESISFSLDEVLETLATVTSQRAADKRIEYVFEIGPDVPRQLRGDPLRLGQVLINLVNNAIKFTDEGGEIRLAVTLNGLQDQQGQHAQLAFSVKDSGIGMTAQQLALLFKPFSQADGSTSRKYGGTGLGLSISQHLVTMMGGSIDVSSTPGAGSTFSFELLLPALPATETGVVPDELNGARLLLVDDNRAARTALAHMLERLPVHYDVAATVEEAIVRLQGADDDGDPYRVVIVDWQLPGLADPELARALHGEGLKHRPRLVRVTPFGHEAGSAAGDGPMPHPADSVLFKPITSSSLTDALVVALGGRERPPEAMTDFGGLAGDTALPQAAGRRVLLVDDNEVNVLIAGELLKAAGLQVDVANDGPEAVRLALQAEPGRYAMIFMDLEMPGMDGHAATREIRRHARLDDTPIIALTAHAIADIREVCIADGMQDYLTKPIYPEQLNQTLARWLAHRASQLPLVSA